MKRTTAAWLSAAFLCAAGSTAIPASADTDVTPMNACSNSTGAPDVTRDSAISSAQIWVERNIPYSEAGTCYSDSTLGTFREDCSGFVSLAWDLDQSYVTHQFNPSDPAFIGITHAISWSDLQPGDALVRDAGGVDHMALFIRWTDSTHYILQDETQPGTGTIQEANPIPLNDGYWSNFQPIRYNQVQEGPSNWATYANGKLRLAQTGSGGDAYENGADYPGSVDWSSWTNLGKGSESFTGPPAFIHHGGQYDLFAVGASGRIWHRVYKDGAWNTWTALTTAAGNPVVAKAGVGVAAVYGRDHVRIFYIGPGGDLYQTYYDNGWISQSLGGDYRGTPGVIIANDGSDVRTDVYVTDADGYIYHRSRTNDGSWTSWVAVKSTSGSQAQALAGTGVAAVHGNGHDRLFYVSPGYHVYQTYYDNGWISQNLDGDYRGVPAVTVTANRIDLYATGAAGNVFHRSRLIGGEWTDWTKIADNP